MYPTNGIAGATEAEVADNNLAQHAIYDDAIVERRIVLEIFLDEAPIKRLRYVRPWLVLAYAWPKLNSGFKKVILFQ